MSTELSRKLRHDATAPEQMMWAILRPFREQGWHFRRQVQIGTYYADFACRRPAVVIEVDGTTHGGDIAQSNDATRDDYFRGRGFRVLRFWNDDVMHSPEGVFQMLTEALGNAAPPTLDPSPQGGGRRQGTDIVPAAPGEGTDIAPRRGTRNEVSPSPLRGGDRGGGRVQP